MNKENAREETPEYKRRMEEAKKARAHIPGLPRKNEPLWWQKNVLNRKPMNNEGWANIEYFTHEVAVAEGTKYSRERVQVPYLCACRYTDHVNDLCERITETYRTNGKEAVDGIIKEQYDILWKAMIQMQKEVRPKNFREKKPRPGDNTR